VLERLNLERDNGRELELDSDSDIALSRGAELSKGVVDYFRAFTENKEGVGGSLFAMRRTHAFVPQSK
jgi:hypothetical protein